MTKVRPIIKCRACNREQPHAAAGMCSPCYKASKNRRMEGAFSIGKVERSASGRPLCRWCKTEVKPPRRTFCSEECVHEWSMRTSPQYVRRKVYERDHAVCAICKLDVDKMEEQLRELRYDDFAGWRAKIIELEANGWKVGRPSGWWEADHIKAVVEGGGMHGLENYRTLCVPCHKKETALLRKRMAVAKRKSVQLDIVDTLPCTCKCTNGATCLDCICHWRHEGPVQISEPKHSAEYWEGKGAKADTASGAAPVVPATPPTPDAAEKAKESDGGDPKPPSDAERAAMAKQAYNMLKDLFG